jgi:hypothetical protein
MRGLARVPSAALQRWACACAVLLALCALSGHARAHFWFPDLHEGQWVLKLGVPVAGSFGPYNRLNRFVSGVELNCGRLDPDSVAWLGGYVDAHWNFTDEQARFSIGPMVGWAMFGLDAGYLLAHDEYGARHGLAVRPFITFGYVAFYYRWASLFGRRGDSINDVGLLIEWPFPLTKKVMLEPSPVASP